MFILWLVLSVVYLVSLAPMMPRVGHHRLTAMLWYAVAFGAGPAALFVTLFWSRA